MYENLFHGLASVKLDENSLWWRGLDDDVDQQHWSIVWVFGNAWLLPSTFSLATGYQWLAAFSVSRVGRKTTKSVGKKVREH